jgi:hypothetical protein
VSQTKKEIKKTIPFTIASKNYLGINLMRIVKDISEIYNCVKKSRKTSEHGMSSYGHGSEESIL